MVTTYANMHTHIPAYVARLQMRSQSSSDLLQEIRKSDTNCDITGLERHKMWLPSPQLLSYKTSITYLSVCSTVYPT